MYAKLSNHQAANHKRLFSNLEMAVMAERFKIIDIKRFDES